MSETQFKLFNQDNPQSINTEHNLKSMYVLKICNLVHDLKIDIWVLHSGLTDRNQNQHQRKAGNILHIHLWDRNPFWMSRFTSERIDRPVLQLQEGIKRSSTAGRCIRVYGWCGSVCGGGWSRGRGGRCKCVESW